MLHSQSYFYPRPPRGGRRQRFSTPGCSHKFLSTPSARRATSEIQRTLAVDNISIHALREEGDDIDEINDHIHKLFLSTPSARRETWKLLFNCLSNPFLSTPSARRATQHKSSQTQRRHDFYPRPPRGGRPTRRQYPLRPTTISIHALREEGDPLLTRDVRQK